MLLKWAGGKSWLVKNHSEIFHNNEILEFKNYIEPFLGGGAVFKFLKPNNNSILADINDNLICFYLCLQEKPIELYELTMSHIKMHSNSYYYDIRAKHSLKDDLEQAARFLYLNRTCYNGIYRVNRRGEFNVPIGSSKEFNVTKDEFIKYSNLLKSSKILKQDFRETIDYAKEGDFIYVDPPYITKSNESVFDMYSKNQFDWNAQIELSKILETKNKDGSYIVVSNIFDKDIVKLFPKKDGWNHIPLNRANVMPYNARGKEYKEIIFKNF